MNKGEGTIGKLLTDDSTVVKLNQAVDNVNTMLGGFRSMDFRLDMNAAQWTSRSDSRTALDIDIVPRHDYWYTLSLASTPDGKISQSTQMITGANGTQIPQNITTVTSDQALTVSAQFAKRLEEHLVLTAGLVESQGGAGAELRFLDDRFRAGVLAYDFTKREDKPNPRYRFTTSYQFYKSLYMQMGVQDIANKDLRTFFFGGGIRWKDDDLKKMVGLASVAH
jgi:phospholipid/cholesterol/gamma-HCH transport system substrate-binding protein